MRTIPEPQSVDIYQTGIRIWNDWTRMWNEEPELALELSAPVFILHLTNPRALDEKTIDSPAAVRDWVISHRKKFTQLIFHTECGPFVDVTAQVVSGPWWAETAVEGKPQPVCGMDTIRLRDGRIVEYWTMSTPVDTQGRWPRSLL